MKKSISLIAKVGEWIAKRWTGFRFASSMTMHPKNQHDDKKQSTESVFFSILLPVYRPPIRFIKQAIDSVIKQSYSKWELCIVDDASNFHRLKSLLDHYKKNDVRINVVYRKRNGGISEASNDAISCAKGEYVLFLDHDDLLRENALSEIHRLIRKNPKADFIYSDEDKVGPCGWHDSPYLKPDWSPDLLLSRMYTCHLGCYRTSLLREIGGFRKEFDGSQDYDLVLRVSEKMDRIAHVDEILYHWRAIKGSTARASGEKDYAIKASYSALQDALNRRNEGGKAFPVIGYPGYYHVVYPIPSDLRISLIVPTRDQVDLLDRCLTSIFDKTFFKGFDIVLIDNGSDESVKQKIDTGWKERAHGRIRLEGFDHPFNFSKICNHGSRIARGTILLFLNNDTEVITPEWLEWMAGFACRESIGAVGAMLLYPDNTIQHAGIVLGVKGIANHHHKGFPVDSPGNNIGQLLSQTNYSAVTGACLMVKRSDFEAVGGFEEELAVAYNDVDLCLKLRKMGKFNVFLPEVRLYHHESKSRGADVDGENAARLKKESDWMMAKWGDWIRNDPFYNPNLTRDRLDYTPDLKKLNR